MMHRKTCGRLTTLTIIGADVIADDVLFKTLQACGCSCILFPFSDWSHDHGDGLKISSEKLSLIER